MNTELILQEETDLIIGVGIDVHKELGAGFLEIVYKDALEYEFKERGYSFQREEEYQIPYKKIILRHKFYADFVVFDKVILEVKAKEGGICDEDLAQTIKLFEGIGMQSGPDLQFCSLEASDKTRGLFMIATEVRKQ